MLRQLEKHSHGFLSKRSHGGKWATRYFYLYNQHLCYLPGSVLPQPQPKSVVRKAVNKWEQHGEAPKKALRLSDIRTIVGDPQSKELELTLADGQKRQYKAISEHEMLLWKRIFEKYARYRAVQ
jgi:hypothetical protein